MAGKTPQGLSLAWILQYRKRRHAADVAATVAALPAKNWPWQPWYTYVKSYLFKAGIKNSTYSVPDEWATMKCDIVHIFYNKH